MRNYSGAASGKLDKGIIRTPPASFLNNLSAGRPPCVRHAKYPPTVKLKPAVPLDYTFDEMPI